MMSYLRYHLKQLFTFSYWQKHCRHGIAIKKYQCPYCT